MNEMGRSQNLGVSERPQDIRIHLTHTVQESAKALIQKQKVAWQTDGKL